MFLTGSPRRITSGGFLRASGGVSNSCRGLLRTTLFSPRKRRCFQCEVASTPKALVFSAQAEVFPTLFTFSVNGLRFLRASGGVSEIKTESLSTLWFSPRKRRCFFDHKHYQYAFRVFSAQAEVFLKWF